jgi:hypothetical protein
MRENVAGCTRQVFRKIGGAWLVINENSARVPNRSQKDQTG